MTRRALIPAATLVAALLAAAPARAEWIWPVSGEVITPYRNGTDPYAAGEHRGIDVAAKVGTPVAAATAGEVRFAGTAGSSGLTVSVRTADGLYDTSYLHLSATTVRKGQTVAAGERVGAVGTTGVRSAEQPHLHFGVRDAGSRHAYHDPLAFLPPAPAGPERPRPAPAPSPDPLPLVPAPLPAPRSAPAPRPAPRGVPAPRHVPRRVPVPRQAPRRVPAPRQAPRPRTAPRALPRSAPVRGTVRRPAPVPQGSTRRVRHSAPGRVPVPRSSRTPDGSPEPGAGRLADGRSAALESRRPAAEQGGNQPTQGGPAAPAVPTAPAAHGPDIGWVLACLGLLAAAALLGLSEDGREATRRATRKGRRRISAFLSPRLGGR